MNKRAKKSHVSLLSTLSGKSQNFLPEYKIDVTASID